jgi:hypothetical protein
MSAAAHVFGRIYEGRLRLAGLDKRGCAAIN